MLKIDEIREKLEEWLRALTRGEMPDQLIEQKVRLNDEGQTDLAACLSDDLSELMNIRLVFFKDLNVALSMHWNRREEIQKKLTQWGIKFNVTHKCWDMRYTDTDEKGRERERLEKQRAEWQNPLFTGKQLSRKKECHRD